MTLNWKERVAEAERSITAQARGLHGRSADSPVNLGRIGRKLGIRIETGRIGGPSGRCGLLSRDDNSWWIRVDDRQSLRRQRFGIAHEIAHALYIEFGLGRPNSKSEYWILEEACNRVAVEILVPQEGRPSRTVSPENLPGLLRGLIQRWLLSQESAAKLICVDAVNDCAVAGISKIDNTALVRWSRSKPSDLKWPGPRSKLDLTGSRFPIIEEFIRQHFDEDSNGETTERIRRVDLDAPASSVVGVSIRRSVSIFWLFQSENSEQLRLL